MIQETLQKLRIKEFIAKERERLRMEADEDENFSDKEIVLSEIYWQIKALRLTPSVNLKALRNLDRLALKKDAWFRERREHLLDSWLRMIVPGYAVQGILTRKSPLMKPLDW